MVIFTQPLDLLKVNFAVKKQFFNKQAALQLTNY
jgi:hypothetical protein